jgi:hypothetical protein
MVGSDMFKKSTMACVIAAWWPPPPGQWAVASTKEVMPSRVWLSQHAVSGGNVRFAMEDRLDQREQREARATGSCCGTPSEPASASLAAPLRALSPTPSGSRQGLLRKP